MGGPEELYGSLPMATSSSSSSSTVWSGAASFEWLALLVQAKILVFDMFTGIGGGILAVQKSLNSIVDTLPVCVATIAYEVDSRCRLVLRRHYSAPGLYISELEDDEGVSGSARVTIEERYLHNILEYCKNVELVLVMGGSPCVGFTAANPNAAGIRDPRSALVLLFPEAWL